MDGAARRRRHRVGKMMRRLVSWALGASALLVASGALSNGVFQSITGDVRAAAGSSSPAPAVAGERFRSGATIRTGAGSAAVLRFDDGHAILLHENGELRIADFRFDRDQPRDDRMELRLVSGALRSVTGLIGNRNRDRVLLSVPQASISVRGTDFTVVLADGAYLSVAQGAIVVSNAAGTVDFSAGALGTVQANASPAAPIASSALPAAVSAIFRSLGSVAMGAPGGSGAGGASTGYFGGGVAQTPTVAGTLAGIAAGVAAIAAAGSRKAATTTTATQH
jgi:hypothetical protein